MRKIFAACFCVAIVACADRSANRHVKHQPLSEPAMESFSFSPESAHPRAKALMRDSFYWSTFEETAPFGNDDGWDAAYSFRDWRTVNKDRSPVIFLRELITGWQYPYFDWNEMNAEKISNYLGSGVKMSETDIRQQVDLIKNATKHQPGGTGMSDEQLRQLRRDQLTKMLALMSDIRP